MTARAITAGELVKLRSGNQWSQLYLAVHKPATVYSARVNQSSFESELVSLTYDGGSGTLANVLPGMTMHIGSSAGARDKGSCRVRKTPTSTIFYIGETSELGVEDNDYITIVDEFRIWSRHIYLTGSTPFMDNDIFYVDQHSVLSPVPVMGPHAVLWLTGATVQFTPSSASSWVHGSSISGHVWAAPGASATSNLNTATPTITYNAPGTYRVSCTVTAANGQTAVGYRYVFVFSSSQMPTTQFKLNSCSGDREEGGWSFGVTLYDEALISDIQDQALIILFSKDFYNGIEESLGNTPGRENIIAIGRVTNENLEHSWDFSTVTFQAKGSHYWLNKITGYPIGMEFSSSPSAWTQMSALTVDRALWHLLHWRSTASMCIDISLTGITSYASAIEAPIGSLWQQILTISDETLLAKPGFDKYDRLFIQVYPSFIVDEDRTTIPTVMEITKEDYFDQYSLERKIVHDTSTIEVSGVSFDGSKVSPFFSRAPGKVLSIFGSVGNMDRLLLEDQTHCNYLSGYLYAHQNNDLPNLDISLAQNNRFIDIAPNQRLTMSILTSDFPRSLSYTSKKFLPRRVEISWEEKSGILTTKLELEGETTLINGKPGVTIIPPTPGSVDVNIPDIDIGLPGFPIFPPGTTWWPPVVPPNPPPMTGCLVGDYITGPFPLVSDYNFLTSEDENERLKTMMYAHANLRPAGVTHESILVITGQLFYLHTDGIWRYSQVPSAFTVRAIGANQDTLLFGENELNSSYAWALVQRANLASWMKPISTTEIHGFEIEISNPTNDGEWNADFDFASYGSLGWSPVGNNPSYPNGNVGAPYPLASYSSSLSCYGTAGGLQVRSVAPPGDLGYGVINIWAFRPEVVFPKAGSHIQFSAWAGSSFTGFGIKYKDASWEFKSFYNPTTQDWYIGSGSYNKEIEAFAFHNLSGGSTWQTLYYANFIGFGTSIQEYRLSIEKIELFNVCQVS